MKFIAIATISMLFTVAANAQKIPTGVLHSFKNSFPEAQNIKWEKEKSNYEAAFLLDQTRYSALFTQKGELLETEIAIRQSQLPKAALQYLKANYSKYQIDELAKITTALGVVTFEAEINGADLIFDQHGNFIKKVK